MSAVPTATRNSSSTPCRKRDNRSDPNLTPAPERRNAVILDHGSFADMNVCPVVSFDRAGEGYAEQVGEWIANPHAYFRAFGFEARAFQAQHRSERLRTMTLVIPAAQLAEKRPVCVSLDRRDVRVGSWSDVFSAAVTRLSAAHPETFDALQSAGELQWLGCVPSGEALASLIEVGRLNPQFADWAEVVARVQWLFLMCGIRLNEVIVQVDPYTDEEWRVRKEEIDRRRSDERAFMNGRREAQKAWAAEHAGLGDDTSSMTWRFGVKRDLV